MTTAGKEAAFAYFVPQKKTTIYSPARLVLVLLISTFLLVYLEPKSADGTIGNLGFLFIISTFLLTIYFLIASPFTFKPLNGSFDGNIYFSEKFISVNDITIETFNIFNVELFYGDIYGKREFSSQVNFNPIRSRGVSNYLKFTDVEKNEYQLFFQIKDVNDQESLAPFIKELTRFNKIVAFK